MDSFVLTGLIVYACLWISVSGAQNPAIRHLNMKFNRLNRITSVLQSDVDEIMKALSSTLIDGHENGTDTAYDEFTTTDSVLQRVNETVRDVQDLKSEVEHLVLYVKMGMKAEKQFQRESVKNLTNSYQESVGDLTKSHLEFQNSINVETIVIKEKINQLELMKEKIDQLESGQLQLQEENQECQRNLENITQVLGESVTENKAGIGNNLAMLHDLVINDTTLKSIIDQIIQNTNENFNKLFACEEVKGWESFDSHCYMFASNTLSWDEAWAACKSENSYMVELNYASEIQYVAGHKSFHGETFWVGANDKETEGNFIWQKSSKKVNADFWRHGEPNNAGNEDCVQMYSGAPAFGKTNDVPCKTKAKFVCERPFLA